MREKRNLGLVIYLYMDIVEEMLWSCDQIVLLLNACFLLLDQIVSFYENLTRGVRLTWDPSGH